MQSYICGFMIENISDRKILRSLHFNFFLYHIQLLSETANRYIDDTKEKMKENVVSFSSRFDFYNLMMSTVNFFF